MEYHGKECCSNESNNEAEISLPKTRRKAYPTSITAVIAGRGQELITEFPSTMKEMNHQINLILVLTLADLLNSSITRMEKLNQPRQVYLLQNAFTTESIMEKSGSFCVKPASAMPQYYENWRIFNLSMEIILNNMYREKCIIKESTVPGIQELLKTTIPSSGIAKFPHYNICQNMNHILPG